jgi:hypothetical protein
LRKGRWPGPRRKLTGMICTRGAQDVSEPRQAPTYASSWPNTTHSRAPSVNRSNTSHLPDQTLRGTRGWSWASKVRKSNRLRLRAPNVLRASPSGCHSGSSADAKRQGSIPCSRRRIAAD